MGQVWAQPDGRYYPVTLGNVPTVFGQNATTYAPQITTVAVGSAAAVAAPEVSVPAAISYAGLSGAVAADAGNAVHNAQTGQPLSNNMATTTAVGAVTGAVAQGAAAAVAPEIATAINAANKEQAASTPTQSAAGTTVQTNEQVTQVTLQAMT